MRLFHSIAFAGLAAGLLASAPAAAVNIVGQSITANYTLPNANYVILQPFQNPAIVGDGVEFTTRWANSGLQQDWIVDVDLFANGFSVSFTSLSSRPNIGGTNPILNLTLDGFSGIEPISLFSYDCATPGRPPCTSLPVWPPSTTIFTSTETSANVRFHALRGGETYVFHLGEAGIVPEPATWALLIAGFGLVGTAMRRRRVLA